MEFFSFSFSISSVLARGGYGQAGVSGEFGVRGYWKGQTAAWVRRGLLCVVSFRTRFRVRPQGKALRDKGRASVRRGGTGHRRLN